MTPRRTLPLVAFGAALLIFGCGGGGGTGSTGSTSGTPSGTAVSGFVRNLNTGAGIAGVRIVLVDAAGAQVGQGTTDASGAFRAPTTTNAVRFYVDFGTVSSGFYRHYDYNGRSYSPLIDGCRPWLPPVQANVTTALPSPIWLRQTTTPPPPPPDGC